MAEVQPNISTFTATDQPTTEKKIQCWCDKDFTVDELKAIVIEMRKTEYKDPKDKLKLVDKQKSILEDVNRQITQNEELIQSSYSRSSPEAQNKSPHQILKSEVRKIRFLTAKNKLLEKKKKSIEASILNLKKQMKEFDSLFFDLNCTLADADKTYVRFTEEINKTCKQYSINSCIRKIHFLSQIYWESVRFTTTIEWSTGNAYDPENHSDAKKMGNTEVGDGPCYRGRGLMQLTWRNNYKAYFKNLIPRRPDIFPPNSSEETLLSRQAVYKEPKDRFHVTEKDKIDVDYAGEVGRNLFVAVDSAGWFWCYGTTVDLNFLADLVDEKINEISRRVNGGGNGKEERKKYYNQLKVNAFNYDNVCKNAK